MAKNPLALGVLASGSGTNLQSIIEAIEAKGLPAEIRVILCNRPDARAMERGRAHGLPVELLDHKTFAKREDFDARLVEILRERGVELVCLAGFDRLITPVFVRAFPGRILNIHPALLPAFKGLHGQRQALEYGVKLAGATVHFVDEETDHGPIVIQAAVPVLDGDDEVALQKRILAEEHRIYPEAIRLFAEGRLRIEGRKVRILDGPTSTTDALTHPSATR
ncbi:MAG: phosphoribosylglycinamide formyltransferase [Candidatus Binatia bacterium]